MPDRAPETTDEFVVTRPRRRSVDRGWLGWAFDLLNSRGGKVGAIIMLLGLGATGAGTARALLSVPNMMAFHDSATSEFQGEAAHRLRRMETELDSVSTMRADLKDIRKVHQEQLCITVSQLRHTDWTRCLVNDAASVIADP